MSGQPTAESRVRSSEAALSALGVACRVEARETLAVLIPQAGERALEDADIRRAVVSALRAFGFTHAAVDVCDERRAGATPTPPA
jgi:hypothetical protein